ncbi:MAG TPA: hypothetical protein VLY24_22735 [Bryobacteraceae bacterium]|nr:hypothetical protein [Bryobacteraceae bacterium]
MKTERYVNMGCVLVLFTGSLWAASVPKPVRSRFVVGDPIWRELPVRPNLQSQYEKCWQTAVNAILENNFDIATMDKDSGYIRTTWNEGLVRLTGDWVYKIQISVKLVSEAGESKPNQPSPLIMQKVRVQVAGEVSNVNKGRLIESFRGYDQVLLQNLFQDLQAKLGATVGTQIVGR